jgi:hypothetical protein
MTMPTARGADAAPIDELLPPNCGPTSQQLAALDAAVAAAFPAFGSLAPNDSADIKGKRHAYLNLPGLLEAVRPALMAQQVIIANTIGIVPGGFVVSTMLRHSGGGWRLSQFPVLSLTSSSAISAAATSGFRVNLQLLLGICASDEDAAPEAVPAAAPQPWEQSAAAPAYAAPPQQPAPQQQPWAAPAPQGGYDMTRAIPQHEIAAAVAAAQQQPNALQYQPTPTDPSAYV